MNGYDHSSQTVFLPRQFVFSRGNSHRNGHRFSSSGPALRAASAEPSAVRPDGLWDHRGSYPETKGVLRDASGDGERAPTSRWQDKAVLTDGLGASAQAGPDTIVARAAVMDSARVRSQNDSDAKERLVKGAVWMRPGVKETLESLADQTGLSFSATAAKGLEVYVRAKIQDQQEALFEPKMRAMMRREIRASDDRHVPFEIKNAVASEQTRILTIDLYKRLLLKEGFTLREINKKVDNAYNMAETNVLNTKTPKFQSLLAEWKRRNEGESGDKQDHASPRQEGNTDKGEAGTDKSQA